VRNFNIFARILGLMKLKNTPVLLTHVGGLKSFTGWEDACDEFCKNYHRLGDEAKRFLAVENDQNSHSVDSCMYIHKRIGIPVVVDHAHYLYNPVKGLSLSDAYRLALPTWKDRCPKVHLCSQSPDKKIHAHGDYISYKDYREVYEAL
jgi:UV DNA damage endonuclease